MSQENLELVVRALRAASERPKPDYETMNELYSPEHVLVPAGAETGLEDVAEGIEGYRGWRRALEQAMADVEHHLQGAVDVGPDTVLAVTTTRTVGKASGAATEQRLWLVITVARGKIVRTEAYVDPAKALGAARSQD